MAQPVQQRPAFNIASIIPGGLGKLLAFIGLVVVIILFVVGRLVGYEAGLFALAFLSILLL